MRIVSLVPSTTETLLAWGADVVACTRFCEQPQLTHVGGTKDPDIAAIVALAPDLVVVDREENRREDADALIAAGLRVHVTDVVALAGVAPMLHELATVTGRATGRDLTQLELPSAEVPWATAFVPIWRRPWMTINADTYGASVLALLGVSDVFGDSSTRYPVVELDEVVARAPTHVLVPTEPYSFKPKHLDELQSALPRAMVTMVDGQDLFWWGERTAGALVRLRAALRGALPPR